MAAELRGRHVPRPLSASLSRALAATIVLAAAVACDAPSTNAPQPVPDYPVVVYYRDPITADLLPFGYHWPLGSVVRVYADPDAQPPGWDLASAVEQGGRLWESQMYYREASLRLVSSPADADVVVRYDGSPPVVSYPTECFPSFPQAAAATSFCPTNAFDALEILPLGSGSPGRVKMEVLVVASRIADEAELRRVVAHEIGHVFGIAGHSGDPADLMYPAPEVDAPSAADGRALRYALHQPDAVTP